MWYSINIWSNKMPHDCAFLAYLQWDGWHAVQAPSMPPRATELTISFAKGNTNRTIGQSIICTLILSPCSTSQSPQTHNAIVLYHGLLQVTSIKNCKICNPMRSIKQSSWGIWSRHSATCWDGAYKKTTLQLKSCQITSVKHTWSHPEAKHRMPPTKSIANLAASPTFDSVFFWKAQQRVLSKNMFIVDRQPLTTARWPRTPDHSKMMSIAGHLPLTTATEKGCWGELLRKGCWEKGCTSKMLLFLKTYASFLTQR